MLSSGPTQPSQPSAGTHSCVPHGDLLLAAGNWLTQGHIPHRGQPGIND